MPVLMIAGVILVGALLVIEIVEAPAPLHGPGTYRDATDTIEFGVPEGWEVIHEGAQTVVRSTADPDLGYNMAALSEVRVGLQPSVTCAALLEQLESVTQAVSPWDISFAYKSVPCAQDTTRPVYARVVLNLVGRPAKMAVLVLGPVGDHHWAVAWSAPLSGAIPRDLVEAMIGAVTTATENQT